MSCRTTWAGRWVLKQGEKRRLAIDFVNLDELDTETLTGTPTVTIDGASGVTISGVAVDGSAVAFWADCATATADPTAGYSEYGVTVAAATTGGAKLDRSATLKIEA